MSLGGTLACGMGDNQQTSPTICKTNNPPPPGLPDPTRPGSPGYTRPSSRKPSVISSVDWSFCCCAPVFISGFFVSSLFFLSLSFPLYLCLLVSLPCFCLFLFLALCFSVSPLSPSCHLCVPQPLSPPRLCLSSLCFSVSWHSLPLPGSPWECPSSLLGPLLSRLLYSLSLWLCAPCPLLSSLSALLSPCM